MSEEEELKKYEEAEEIGQKLLHAFIEIMNGQPGYVAINALQGTVALILKGCAKDKTKESVQKIGMQFLLKVCELLEFLSQEENEENTENEKTK